MHSLGDLEEHRRGQGQRQGLTDGLQRAPVPISLWVQADGTFRLADVNAAGCEFAGFTREQMVGIRVERIGGNGVRAGRDMLTASLQDRTITREMTHVFADGDVRKLEVLYVGLAPGQVLAFARDITGQRAAEERLKISESRYRALVAAANEGVWLVDTAGRTTFANRKVGTMLGRQAAEIAEGNLLDFVDPRDRPSVAGALECPRDTPEAFEARFRHADGRVLLCLLSVSPMPSDNRAPSTLCVLADMTVLQRERELRLESERRFRQIVETTNEGVWTGDRHGCTTFVNQAAAAIVGLDVDEIIGRPFSDFVLDAAQADRVREKFGDFRSPLRGELRLINASGSPVDVHASVSVLRSDTDEIIGSLAVISDVTQMKREQADLRESRERFAQVFEEAPVGIVFMAAGRLVRNKFLGVNPAFCRMVGYTEDELIERDLLAITHPDDVELEQMLAHELFESERNEYVLDKRFVRANGEAISVRFRAHLLRDDRGAPLYGLGVAVDISAEQAAHAMAIDAEERSRAVLDSTPDAVLEVAADGTVIDLNQAALLTFGLERRDAIGASVVDRFVPSRLHSRFADALADWLLAARVGRTIVSTETTMQRSDGSDFPAMVTITPVARAEPVRLTLYVRNLGIQDKAEAARREADERFQRLFRDSATPTVLIDLKGRVTDVNAAFCTLTAAEPLELVGQEATSVLRDVGDAAEAPWLGGAERPGPLSAVRRVESRDGRSAVVQIAASLVRDVAGVPREWICQCTPRALAETPPLPEGCEPLSYRERQVLSLLARGHDGPAIAERLGLAPETVRSYAAAAREKMGATTRTEAVALALMRGEITL